MVFGMLIAILLLLYIAVVIIYIHSTTKISKKVKLILAIIHILAILLSWVLTIIIIFVMI